MSGEELGSEGTTGDVVGGRCLVSIEGNVVSTSRLSRGGVRVQVRLPAGTLQWVMPPPFACVFRTRPALPLPWCRSILVTVDSPC